MINGKRRSIICVALVSLGGCLPFSTRYKVSDQRPVRGVQLTAQSKSSAHSPVPANSQTTAVSASSSQTDYEALFEKLIHLENQFTESDRQIVLNMPARPKSGTIQEATLVLGIFRAILTPLSSDVSGQKQPLTPSQPLEVLVQDKGLDITSALTTNPYLKNRSIFTMALDAVNQTGNSQAFSERLLSVLRGETSNWSVLAAKLGPTSSANSQPATEINNSSASTAPAAQVNDGAQSSESIATNTPGQNPNEPSQGDTDANALMSTALDLAARAQLAEAIVTAKKIPVNSGVFESAKHNIKSWSDRAAQDLRKQAAQQYRASSSVNDPNGKKIYLITAKNLLEEAITKYPDSSNLDTIKENLEIIDQELGRLR